jgi:hypothetical protein
MMTKTFETAKIRDKVYSHTFGWGEIECIDRESFFPIEVRFPTSGVYETFTLEGYCYDGLPVQSLFWDEVDIEAPFKPLKSVSVKTINGFEIPDISFTPDVGESCYLPDPTSASLYSHHVYRAHRDGIVANKHLSSNGLCYPLKEEGRQAAILHAKAMLNLSLSQ